MKATRKTERVIRKSDLISKILVTTLATIALASTVHAAVVVSPANMDGWAFYKTDGDPTYTYGAGAATAEMVNGPATPPLGTGSAHFNTGSDGSQSAQLRLSSWAGTAIGDLTSLSYSTYATSWNGQQMPYLTIYLSNGDRLWFEPDYSSTDFGGPQPAPALNTWQTWDALNGKWYSDNISGPGSNAKTWSYILAAEGPGVTIVADGAGRGGIRIASGFASPGDVFNAYVDNFTIGTAAGTTTYDFEAVPEPTTLSLMALAIGGLALIRKRK
jgi:PEP-CTERM motif